MPFSISRFWSPLSTIILYFFQIVNKIFPLFKKLLMGQKINAGIRVPAPAVQTACTILIVSLQAVPRPPEKD